MPDLVTPFGGLVVWAAIGYLLGSIPFGMVLARVMGLGNLREIGSGNIGATNVLRTGSKSAAALTVLLDGGKGVIAVLMARWLAAEDAAQLAGFCAMLGHCFPIWLGFRGGKGVATYLGLLLVQGWPVGVGACLTWLAAAFAFRYSSLAALVAAASSLVWAILWAPAMLVLCAALTALIFWRHGENIRRLLSGQESKIGAK